MISPDCAIASYGLAKEGNRGLAPLAKLKTSAASDSKTLGINGRLRVLGVDPGSSTTGYGVIEGDGRKTMLVEYSGIKVSPRLSIPDRLFFISSKLITEFMY